MARGVYWIVEQPHSTVMFEYPPFKRWLAKLESRGQDAESSSAGRVQRVSTQMGAFGMRSVKETILLGTAPYLDALVRRQKASTGGNTPHETIGTSMPAGTPAPSSHLASSFSG